MDSRCKPILKILLLLTVVFLSGVFFKQIAFSCSVSNYSDCFSASSCKCGASTNCVQRFKVENVIDYENYRSRCETYRGNFEKVRTGTVGLGGTSPTPDDPVYMVLCYTETSASRPWPDAEVDIRCSCIPCSVDPSDDRVSNVARDLGLDEVSLKGIFAGQLSVNQLIQFAILLVLSVLTLILLFIIIKSGIMYAGSADDEQKKKSAINGIKNALIGAAIVFGSYLILSIFFSFFGLSPFKKIVPVECEGLTGEAYTRCLDLVNED